MQRVLCETSCGCGCLACIIVPCITYAMYNCVIGLACCVACAYCINLYVAFYAVRHVCCNSLAANAIWRPCLAANLCWLPLLGWNSTLPISALHVSVLVYLGWGWPSHNHVGTPALCIDCLNAQPSLAFSLSLVLFQPSGSWDVVSPRGGCSPELAGAAGARAARFSHGSPSV